MEQVSLITDPFDEDSSQTYVKYEYLEEEDYNREFSCTNFNDIEEIKEQLNSKHFQFACAKCDKKYFQERSLKKHLRCAHLESLNLECKFCKKLFRTKYNLQQHLITHSSKPAFECSYDDCKKRFRHINSLKQHTHIHMKTNRKQCPVCKEYFTKLEIHKLVHLDEKPFKCDECDKTFTAAKTLREHKYSIHAGGKFECKECNANFTNPGSLYKHKKSIHAQVIYNCPECKKQFNRKDNLTIHIKNVHKTEE